MTLEADATEVLRQTSRTFYLSIVRLPPQIREAVMSSYLSMRAIDEIEDHERLDKRAKIGLLCDISDEFQSRSSRAPRRFSVILKEYRDELPEVTNRLDEWAELASETISPCIYDATAAMARRMAYWVGNDWRIRTKRDLDRYTFSVAGAVGVLLSDLWTWYDGTASCTGAAVGYGRGLQAVNILRNRAEDLERGVDFFPDGWAENDFRSYARRNLSRGDAFVRSFPSGPAREFCQTPQDLAHATLDALERGEPKLSRSVVLEFVERSDSRLNTEAESGSPSSRKNQTTLT